ncbi:unnamed protein product, partial [Lampetra planeri]
LHWRGHRHCQQPLPRQPDHRQHQHQLELTNSLAGVGDVSFDADSQFPLDELKIDPLTLDGLHMLNDPDMVLADPATEDTFRMDRL